MRRVAVPLGYLLVGSTHPALVLIVPTFATLGGVGLGDVHGQTSKPGRNSLHKILVGAELVAQVLEACAGVRDVNPDLGRIVKMCVGMPRNTHPLLNTFSK